MAGDLILQRLLVFAVLILVAACRGGGDSSSTIQTDLGPDLSVTIADLIVEGPTTGDLASPWNRYFVSSYDADKVAAMRDHPGFRANDFSWAGRRSNPLLASRLDYALSTGLTGAGQIVSLIDNAVRLNHEQFAGKTIYTSGSAPASGDYHGTAVASIMAGTGDAGGMIGIAPAADIHQGYLDFNSGISWTSLRDHMNAAADVGAVVSNNSWGLTGQTVANNNVATYFNDRNRRRYVDGLRNFAQDGVIVFAMQNDVAATSASLMAALPLGVPDLEKNWIAVINAIPILTMTGLSAPPVNLLPALKRRGSA